MITVPEQQVACCDSCGRTNVFLTKCTVCSADFCIVCEPYTPEIEVKAHICAFCWRDFKKVVDICDRAAKEIRGICTKRDKALAAYGKSKRPRKVIADRLQPSPSESYE